jgi:GTP-binding protein EngB required for normal cell division
MSGTDTSNPRQDEVNPLRDYVAAKQVVAEAVLAVQRQADALDDREQGDAFRELLVQLAEDRFNLVVVGQFKRGKSSLMNAIIGRDLLPTGVLPLTSAITTLCYGPQERALLRFKGWSIEDEIPLERLPVYVTERGNPGNAKGLLTARVELPSPFLRRGLNFIDTPGIGSAQTANTQTTYDFLPNADAVVFVTSVEGPLAEAEVAFLQDIRHAMRVRKLFIVVNKLDLLAEAEQKEVLEYLRAEIERQLGGHAPIFPLSARQALAAKLNGQAAEVETSGLAALERDLAAFLAGERQQAFLLSIVDRALRLLEAGPGSAEGQDTGGGLGRQRLEELRVVLATGAFPPPATPEVRSVAPKLIAPALKPEPAKPQPWLTKSSCPTCAATVQAVFDFFVGWQSALARSPEDRRRFAALGGFCAAHTWQFAQIAAPHDLSLGYAPLVEAAMAGLRRALKQDALTRAGETASLLLAKESCPACALQRDAEAAQLKDFLGHISVPNGRQAYSQARGLCLPHLAAMLEAAPPEVGEFLLKEQVQRLEHTAEDMRGYALKRAALRRGLTNREEEHAWQRALIYLVGERNARALDARGQRG